LECFEQLSDPWDTVIRALSYNDLLDFPYLTVIVCKRFDAAIPGNQRKVTQRVVSGLQETENCGAASGPWVEIAGRAVSSLSFLNKE
jgi:hypothetical protein